MASSTTDGVGGVIALGVIQGLTEFLPISSSGHLVVGSTIIKLAAPSLLLDVLLHVGTLLPVLWLYRADIVAMIAALGRLPRIRERWDGDGALRLLVCVVVASVPTALAGLLLQEMFERLFSSTFTVGCALIVTGVVLMLTRLARRSEADEASDGALTLTPWRALAVGVAQGAAITPGISRSGATIATGLLLGIERETAARFSFILSVPAIVGAALLQLRGIETAAIDLVRPALGMVAAATSGYLALRWVVRVVRRGELHWFAWYVWPLGAAVLVYSLLAG